jgi:hypothetical protein
VNFPANVSYRHFAWMTTDNPGEISAASGQRWTETPSLRPYVVGGARLIAPAPLANQPSCEIGKMLPLDGIEMP